MKKIMFIVGTTALVALGIYSMLNFPQKTIKESGKITVISTLFPMYDFSKTIGGDKVEVSLLLPPGVEAHTFEPKPSDIAKISKANIFVYTGEFMEPWAHDIIAGVKGDKVKIVDASTGVKLMKVDPHIWLDFDNAKIMAETIAKALAEVDPANATYYQDNAKKLSGELILLDDTYKRTLSNCQSKQIVYGGHYAFGYMAERYGLKYMAAQGFSPDSEPTAKDMIALVSQIKKNNIKYIFYEELSSPKIAETLIKETSAQMLLLNGTHNLTKEDYENNVTYISLMESNLQNLSLGLDCQK